MCLQLFSVYCCCCFFSSLHDYFHTIANRMCKTLPANLLTNSNSQMKNKMSMFFYLFVLFSICFIIFVTPKWHHSTNNSMDFVFINIFCLSLTRSVWMFVCVLRINFASSFWHQWFDVIPWNRLYKAGMLQQQRKKKHDTTIRKRCRHYFCIRSSVVTRIWCTL